MSGVRKVKGRKEQRMVGLPWNEIPESLTVKSLSGPSGLPERAVTCVFSVQPFSPGRQHTEVNLLLLSGVDNKAFCCA